MRPSSERVLLAIILLMSASLGLAYALITPAFINADEPGHFQYVREVALHHRLPDSDAPDGAIVQSIIDAVIWNHHLLDLAGRMSNTKLGPLPDAAWIRLRADLQTRAGYADPSKPLFIDQLDEPPAYYLLASLFQFPVMGSPTEVQLLATRLTSILLGVLTIFLTYLSVREIFPEWPMLYLGVPALIALQINFTSMSAAVNNTMVALPALTFTLYASVRMIRRGFSWGRSALLIGVVIVCLLSKSTALPGVLAGMAAFILAWPRLRLRWLLPAAAGIVVAAALLILSWQRPAYWYPTDTHSTRETADPSGDQVFTTGGDFTEVLWQPISSADLAHMRARTVTIGVWMRAPDGLQRASLPDLLIAPSGLPLQRLGSDDMTAEVNEEWTWHTQTFELPDDTLCAVVLLGGSSPTEHPVDYDDVIMTLGDSVPDAPSNTLNIIRNPSAETGWPLLRPEVQSLLPRNLADTGLHLNARLASFLDWRFNTPFLITMLRWLFTTFWSRYGSAYPGLPRGPVGVLAVSCGISMVGLIFWLVKKPPQLAEWQRRSFLLYVLICAAALGMVIFRLDPIRLPAYCEAVWRRYMPTGYYLLPSIQPLMTLWLIGLLAWIPRSRQRSLLAVCILVFFLLNLASLLWRQIPGYLSFYGIPFEPDTWHIFYP